MKLRVRISIVERSESACQYVCFGFLAVSALWGDSIEDWTTETSD